ncbi:LysR family transcriptional regulator [Sphingobium chungbukense]|uniref:LysR family transcriptional regulator n=1 Tax=Sphingobium chungbukense TaxID=56193 RepID=A0A0M3ASW1_9SPHN|nr:LysR family transcriptional regulator [Sphingobium chungbukense]KKW93272.1 LysR family transcriptional regulator [Sphingobium chungbukense]
MTDLLIAMRTFVRLCERPNFSRVAAEMHASHTTIARRLDQVEAHFGATLFHRTTRRLIATPDADRLLVHARSMLDALDVAEQDFGPVRNQPSGLVRIGFTTALGLYYVERLGELTALHPALQLDCAMTDWQRDVVEDRLDLALRVGPVSDDSLVIHPLGLLARLLVAHPAYLERHGAAACAEDLLHHQCIAYAYGDVPARWTIDGRERVVGGTFRSDSSEAVHRAALSGLGIALLPAIRVRDDIEAGRLVPVLPDSVIAPLDILAVHPSHKRLPPRARVVLDFLKANFPGDRQGGAA